MFDPCWWSWFTDLSKWSISALCAMPAAMYQSGYSTSAAAAQLVEERATEDACATGDEVLGDEPAEHAAAADVEA